MGHEWITRLAVLELLGGDPVLEPDPDDPRRTWTRPPLSRGLAKDTDLSSEAARRELARLRGERVREPRYRSLYGAVHDAILGERWVDIAGFNVVRATLGRYNCFDAVAQEPAEIQYDHFMRRYDDRGGEGGVRSARLSQQRFVRYFVAAATAPPGVMTVWDGGGSRSAARVDRNYFLFGRAVHLFEDSFSAEHTVRLPEDNYQRVRQVKSYLCAAGAEQHARQSGPFPDYRNGDVIWRPGTGFGWGWRSYRPSHMKAVALVATEATKDLWAAFIRTMGTSPDEREARAASEAARLVEHWLRFDPEEVRSWYADSRRRDATYVLTAGESGPGRSVEACMRGLGVASGSQLGRVAELEREQRVCLYNLEARSDPASCDAALRMPFDWRWKRRFGWEIPPPEWPLPRCPEPSAAR